jgi:hypothetical protein
VASLTTAACNASWIASKTDRSCRISCVIDSMFSVSFIFTGCAIATDGVPFIRKGNPGTVPDPRDKITRTAGQPGFA